MDQEGVLSVLDFQGHFTEANKVFNQQNDEPKRNKKQPGSNRENQSENIPACLLLMVMGLQVGHLKRFTLALIFVLPSFMSELFVFCSAQFRVFATVSLSFVCGTRANQVE